MPSRSILQVLVHRRAARRFLRCSEKRTASPAFLRAFWSRANHLQAAHVLSLQEEEVESVEARRRLAVTLKLRLLRRFLCKPHHTAGNSAPAAWSNLAASITRATSGLARNSSVVRAPCSNATSIRSARRSASSATRLSSVLIAACACSLRIAAALTMLTVRRLFLECIHPVSASPYQANLTGLAHLQVGGGFLATPAICLNVIGDLHSLNQPGHT